MGELIHMFEWKDNKTKGEDYDERELFKDVAIVIAHRNKKMKTQRIKDNQMVKNKFKLNK